MPVAKQSSGAILPRDMGPREWLNYNAQVRSEWIREGQTGYDTGTGFWFGLDNGVPKFSIGNSAGNKVTWNGTDLTVVGNITLQANAVGENELQDDSVSSGKLQADSVTADKIDAGAVTATKIDVSELSAISADLGSITGGDLTLNAAGSFIKLGTAGYGTGVGLYTEYNAGTPRLFLGDASGNFLSWDGAGQLRVNGQLELGNIQTFTPTWTGFSTDPSGDISYADLGNFAIMFVESALTNTSDATDMSLTGVPAEIRSATAAGTVVQCFLRNNGAGAWGAVNIDNSGGMQFLLFTGTPPMPFSLTGFTASGAKGLPSGFFIMYPK